MDNQTFFNKTMDLLVKQEKPSRNALTGECFYRGPEGTKCAIGHHIPDDVYRREMEGKSVRAIMQKYLNIRGILEGVDYKLLGNMQIAHDRTKEGENCQFRDEFFRIEQSEEIAGQSARRKGRDYRIGI